MTSVSQTVPPARSGGPSLLRTLLYLWKRRRQAERASRQLAALDERALRDLGLPGDIVDPPMPRDPAGLWLNRVPG